jgi:uncharacterized Zn-binding protein involved in type VI secretion
VYLQFRVERAPASVKGGLGSVAGATIVSGSATVILAGKPAARMGDRMSDGGSIISGSTTVDIGG